MAVGMTTGIVHNRLHSVAEVNRNRQVVVAVWLSNNQ